MLVSLDTVRADHLSLYGYSRPTSPGLEELAREAVVFERFFANGGGTMPSHTTMITSLRPAAHGVSMGSGRKLPEGRTTLAEVLRDSGYRTAAFVDAGWVRGRFGFDQGFDLYDDAGGHFAAILPKVERWLGEHAAEEPFFLFVHTYDAHSEAERLPYDCPGDYPRTFTTEMVTTFDGCREGECASRFLKWVNDRVDDGADAHDFVTPEEVEFIRALYDGCLAYVDAKLRELVGWLRELPAWDRTLLVVTSDHGEEFLDHGKFLHVQYGYDEFLRVPMLMKLPDGAYGGTSVPHLGAMIDLMPTVLDVVGLDPPPEAQGTSLLPAIVEDRPVRGEVTAYAAIRTLRWKLLGRERRLFDVVHDPAESVDLYDREPEAVAELRRRLARIARENRELRTVLEAQSPPEELALEEDEGKELRALGYL